MGQRRNMPTKKDIAKHWNMDDDYCWGCGINTNHLDRSHILARVSGGSYEADNLVLLCRFCHNHIQEPLCYTEYGRKKFINEIKDGIPFFNIMFSFQFQRFKMGLFDQQLEHMGYSKDIIKEVKNMNLNI